MNLQTFKAPSMAEALRQVKTAMGQDAMILHTRTYRTRRGWNFLRGQEVVEITASNPPGAARGRRLGSAAANLAKSGPVPGGLSAAGANSGTWPGLRPGGSMAGGSGLAGLGRPGGSRAGGSVAGLPAYGPGSANPANNLPAKTSPAPASLGRPGTPAENGKQLLESPAAGNAIALTTAREVADLKRLVHTLVNEQRQGRVPAVPEGLLAAYHSLVRHEVCREVAEHVVRALHRDVRPEYLSQPGYVRDKLIDQIDRSVAVTGPVVRKQADGPHVLALVGPTGVGKTTTLAKLAANLKLKDRHRVGLVTLDTYRIAAVEQLKRYADIIGSPLRVVSNPDELREAVTAMADMHFVLIDTAGRSPNDAAKLGELRELLGAIKPDEVHLVLSCTSTPSCIDLAVREFDKVRVDKIVFTKLDEAAHAGVVLNVAHRSRKPLSYVTTGQDVPNDIEVACGRRIAERLVDGPDDLAAPSLVLA